MPLDPIPTRCNPHPVSQLILSDDDGEDGVLVDGNETALLVQLGRAGAGYLSEYERQAPE